MTAAEAADDRTLAAMIDHTILKPEATGAEIARYCAEARAWGFRAVCVNPDRVAEVAAALGGGGVAACAVVGFPLGATTSAVKAAEAREAVAAGASEIDMVLPIGRLRDGAHDAVRRDIATVRAACPDALLKVILETCLLDDAEKAAACRLAVAGGADFVKTSTGFAKGGATLADVALMRRTVGDAVGVKASGGIRTAETARAMIAAGATRIGTSNGVALMSRAAS